MVPIKGPDANAVKMMNREMRLSGYLRMVFKTDQGPLMLAVLEAVKREKRWKSQGSERRRRKENSK